MTALTQPVVESSKLEFVAGLAPVFCDYLPR